MWRLLTDYFTPNRDCGVSLPSGACKLIHVRDKRAGRIVERRRYLQSRVCSSTDCVTTAEIVFYKDDKRGALFAFRGRGRSKNELIPRINKLFSKMVHDFASTVKPGKEDHTDCPVLDETWCNHCDRFINLLEFGKITALNNYSREEFDRIMKCTHGGQFVGNHINFFLFCMVQFFVGTKLLLYNNVESAPKLDFIYSFACDGQTFMPYHRQYLHLWMKDLEATNLMCKAAFRCIYLIVYLRCKFNLTYNFETERFLGDDHIYINHCF